MKAKPKHRSNKNGKRLQIRQCTYYEPDFKKAVVLYAEQKSTSEAKRRYGISESNIRRWRRLRNEIMEKAAQGRPARKCKKANSTLEGCVEDLDVLELSNSLDSMPLEQRLTKVSTDEPVLQSQPLSPTKLKVTRQSAKPPQLSPKPPTPEPPNEEVCLRWNSHHSNMQTTFPNILLREQYVDATLVAEGQTLKCHRLILSSCSPYFEEVLSGISPFQHPVLFMKDVPFWILKSLCDFMYAGEVHIFQNRLQELLAVAETLKIKGLAGKQDATSEETKPAEPIKPIKEEKEKKEEKETPKEKKKPIQNETPAKGNSKSKTAASKRNEKAVKEIVKRDDIIDPLDLLEPVYEELTKESKANSTTAKFKESKVVPVRRNLQKKIKKRKMSEREESPPPFLSRKGTRSRPNVKIPKFYHPPYDRNSKAMESPESTIVREPHTDQADPLLQVEEIKAEPLDMEDDVIEIEDNVIGFTDHEMSLHEEEIMGNYDSPIVNPDDDRPSVTFKKINLVQQPIIMDVHTITEKPAETLKIIDVAQITRPKQSDLETDPIMIEMGGDKNFEDPLNINTELEKSMENEEPKENAIGFRIEEVVGAQEEEKETGEDKNNRQPDDSTKAAEKEESPISFRIEGVVGGQEDKEDDMEFTVADGEKNNGQPVEDTDKEESDIGFRIEKVTGGHDKGPTVADDDKNSSQIEDNIEKTVENEESNILDEETVASQSEADKEESNEDRNSSQVNIDEDMAPTKGEVEEIETDKKESNEDKDTFQVDVEMAPDKEESAGIEENETTLDEDANTLEPGFHIAKVAEEQIAAEENRSEALTEDRSGELGFQIASVSSQFDCELTNSFPTDESHIPNDAISDETQMIADSLEELLEK